jgi:hypothetical protein
MVIVAIQIRQSAAPHQADAHTPSLRARAFAGDLVPKNPTDEPAEQLLERIRKSDSCAGDVPKRKRNAARE